MNLLQVALIFLIVLLSIFLAIAGIQIFLILQDLKKVLSKLNKLLQAGAVATNLVTTAIKKDKPSRSKPKRFYKKIL